MRFPGELSGAKSAAESAAEFMREYWQKRPLRMRGALETNLPILEAEELAWLATQDDVESRLVFTERDGSRTRYRVETGPFDDAYLGALPATDWTLLVQDVEKHLPDFRVWLSQLDFIPEWRFDDLMISFAAPGGSVGPHVDNYDVFLCQVQGQREWRISEGAIAADADACTDLALLQPFADPDPFRAKQNDVLYLPPGIAHWGLASDACMTYSIGMRAPSRDELRCTFDRLYEKQRNPFSGNVESGVEFYVDSDLAVSDYRLRLTDDDLERCGSLLCADGEISVTMLADTLGCTVTDIKAWLDPRPDQRDVKKFLKSLSPDDIVNVHGMARSVLSIIDSRERIYLNGEGLDIPAGSLQWLEELCHTRETTGTTLLDAPDQNFLHRLLAEGMFDLSAKVDH